VVQGGSCSERRREISETASTDPTFHLRRLARLVDSASTASYHLLRALDDGNKLDHPILLLGTLRHRIVRRQRAELERVRLTAFRACKIEAIVGWAFSRRMMEAIRPRVLLVRNWQRSGNSTNSKSFSSEFTSRFRCSQATMS